MCADAALLFLASTLLTPLTLPGGTIDVSLGPAGSILCLRPSSPELVVLEPNGETTSLDLDGVVIPVSIAAMPDGSFLVCDAASDSILRFSSRAERSFASAAPPGTIAVAASRGEVWCFSVDEGAVSAVLPAVRRIARVEGFRPADLSIDGRRAVLSSGAGAFLVEPGSAEPLPGDPACLAGGACIVLLGDSLTDPSGGRPTVFAGAGFDRLEGHPDGRVLAWSSSSMAAVLLE